MVCRQQPIPDRNAPAPFALPPIDGKVFEAAGLARPWRKKIHRCRACHQGISSATCARPRRLRRLAPRAGTVRFDLWASRLVHRIHAMHARHRRPESNHRATAWGSPPAESSGWPLARTMRGESTVRHGCLAVCPSARGASPATCRTDSRDAAARRLRGGAGFQGAAITRRHRLHAPTLWRRRPPLRRSPAGRPSISSRVRTSPATGGRCSIPRR